MNALGGRGMYPIDRRLPGGARLRVGGGAGVSEGGNRAEVGEGGSGDDGDAKSSSANVTGVTFGANVTGRGEIPYIPALAGVKASFTG